MSYYIKNSLEELIPYLAMTDVPWGIRDLESVNVYVNAAGLRMLSLPKNYDIVGRVDQEAPADWSELAEEYVAQDGSVIRRKANVPVIETSQWYGNSHLSVFIGDKYPIFRGDTVVGTIWSSRPFQLLTPMNYFKNEKARFVSSLAPTDTFTPTELKVIFFLIQRHSAKEISKALDIAPRTIERHIYSIYQKAEVSSLHQFIEYALVIGLDCYIPEDFIVRGVNFI
ncbi:helix-turn-helix transcriptional regulator [Serratia sp. DD3]|uniref:helix-turn-helix transcriptional regulator n=1 Tax=Serratia sp. DD3 TaxID=1410619 RepID=UPI0003C503B9|nr:helix-turn-helix transcriptional regulator [Serratia sp. DD3]KEY58953.1 bacterial regulatory protein, luxR family [Serratia sp. DD3]